MEEQIRGIEIPEDLAIPILWLCRDTDSLKWGDPGYLAEIVRAGPSRYPGLVELLDKEEDALSFGLHHQRFRLDRPFPAYPLRWAKIEIEDESGVLWLTNCPRTVIHHSPSGHSWGYGGSGPTDFALDVLTHLLPPGGVNGFAQCRVGVSSNTAFLLSPQFKHEIVSGFEDCGSLSVAEISHWVRSHEHTPAIDWKSLLPYLDGEDWRALDIGTPDLIRMLTECADQNLTLTESLSRSTAQEKSEEEGELLWSFRWEKIKILLAKRAGALAENQVTGAIADWTSGLRRLVLREERR